MKNEEIKLGKVGLRALEPEDLDMLYSIENDRKLWYVGTANVPYSRYLLHDYIANATGDIYTDKQVRMVITLSGKAVGLVDLFDFSPQHLRAEVGIAVLADYQGNGCAAEALQQLIDYARTTLHLHQLYALVAASNEKALSLFSKAGFLSSNVLNDWLFDGQKYENVALMQFFL